MSATSEDAKNLNKKGETPATALSEDIPIITPTDVSSSVPKNVVETASQGDYLEDPREVESIIEKKLPTDKEKAIDVDSELDFELKWDDDTDLNENQGDNDDIDLDSVDKALESELASVERDLDTTKKVTESLKEMDTDSQDKGIDSAFASTEKELHSLHKTDSSVTSIEKDLDSVDKEADSAFTSTEKDLDDLDREIETNSMSIEKGDSFDKEKVSAFTLEDKDASKEIGSNLISTDKDFDSVHKKKGSVTPGDNLDKEMEDAAPENVLGIVNKDIHDATTSLEKDNAVDEIAMVVDYVCEDVQTKAAANESGILPKDSVDAWKTEEIFEDKTINVEASAKINIGIETSPVESETNSLDEELVYSDADAPDIQDKDLMDKIDAKFTAEINEDSLENAETLQISSEILTIHKQSEGKTTAKEASDTDVEVNSIKSSNLTKDLNETCSSVTELETSTYDINNEHGLDRPDVMIDIPTQELIESFDDSDDIAEYANNKLDQSQIKIMDKPNIETTSKTDTQKITEPQAIEDEINLEKDSSDEVDEAITAIDMLLTDDKENSVETNKSAGDAVQAESMEVDTDDVSKEIEKPDIMVNSELHSNVETNTLDQKNVSTLKEKVSHADVILEATTEVEAVTSTPEFTSGLANEDKIVESENSKLNELENTLATVVDITYQVESTDDSKLKDDTTLDSHMDEIQLPISSKEDKDETDKDVESTDNSKLMDDTTLDSHMDEAELPMSSKEDKDESDKDFESTDNSKLKDDTTLDSHMDEAQLPMSSKEDKDESDKDVESTDNSKLKDDTTLDSHMDEVQLPISSKEDKDVESTDNSKLKDDTTLDSHMDEAQLPMSSKEDKDESDKDFESTDNSKLKDDTTLDSHMDEAQLPMSSKEDKDESDKDVESTDNSKLKDTTLDSHMDEVQLPISSKQDKDVDSTDNSNLKDDTTLDSHMDEPQLPMSSIEDNDETSDIIKLKEDTVHVKEAPLLTSAVIDIKSSDDTRIKDVVATSEPQADEVQPSTSTEVKESSDDSKLKETETLDTLKESSGSSKLKEVETDEAQPSTSKEVKESLDSLKLKEVEQELSTSNHSELSDEDQEATDSLGLLAESSRVMDDDDDQEQEAEPEDDDDDDDFDQDDESNQMAAEHSEDSNAQHSEADVPREAIEVDESNDMGDPHDLDDAGDEHEDESNDSNDEGVDLQIQIADVVSQTVEAIAKAGEIMEVVEDTEKLVAAILEDKKEEIADVSPVASAIKDSCSSDAVKLTDTDSDSAASSKLRELLLKDKSSSAETSEAEKKSPSKIKKLEISTPKNEISIVELEESSSEDVLADVQEVQKSEPAPPKEVTSLIVPAEVEVTAADKAAPQKPVRLNTDEVSIKTVPAASVAIPETKVPKSADPKTSIDFGLEIYSLDSDDEETEVRSKRKNKLTAVELDNARPTNKCINVQCTSEGSVPLVPASMAAAVYYAANQQRGGGLCLYCAKRFEERSEKLIQGVKDLTPFLSMDMCMIREEFVEISDSDSEDEPEVSKDDEIIGEQGAKFLKEHLVDVINVAWEKFDIEARLLAAQAEINVEVGQLEEECKEIDAMLNECQRETDKLRNDLYTRFADDRRELPAITIFDTTTNQWSGLEEGVQALQPDVREPASRYGKRRAAAAPAPAPPAKRAAIPLGYAPLDNEHKPKQEPKPGPSAEVAASNDEDNADISLVDLSVVAAPAGLPPPGVATRPPLRPNMLVFAMRNTFGAWHKVRITEVQPKLSGQFTTCRVRFEQPKTMSKLLPARCLAYEHPPDVQLVIGTRVVALFKDHRVSADKKEEGEKKEAYYSGIVAETPNPVNSFRYLIFFDDGYAQYVQHSVTRLVCECAQQVWDEVHPFSRKFVRDYLRAYPERPMVRLHAGQSIKTEWDGKWWVSKVLQVDASLVLVYFEGKKDNKTEWIYRGSTRLAPLYLELQAAERTRARPLPRAQAARRFNMPYVEYTRSDETAEKVAPTPTPTQTQAQIEQEIRRQRAVAKKSTAFASAPLSAPAPAPAAAPAPAPLAPRDNVTSRVVFYTPKNAIKPHKMVSHTCGPRCKRTDVLALKDLRTYNPLTKPLLSGWERQQVKYRIPAVKAVMYRAPCGRRIRDYKELHQYLQAIDSDMGVDLFDFNPATHCLAEFLLNKCLISKKDLSHGKENVPVPCVNYYDSSLPEFCSYNTERTPTAGVPLNLDPEFLCGCDCTDDCADKSKCACWKMTLEGARTIGLDSREVGYVYKRLPEPLPSGIYECNVRCKCKQTCMNRVAQHPLQLKLQVFKTANRGWGIRALNDVPKGAFLCVYAGNLLTDATANLDGLNEGDEYLAELDYIEVVEQMKEGFEEDIPADAKKLDEEDSESSSMSSSDEEQKQDGDDDFRPAMPTGHYTPSEYSKRLRKREKTKKAKEKEEREKKEREDKQREKDGEDCITISDDEELREPGHFSVQTGMKGNKFISKYKSVRTLFGKDEACYIMDAKVQGNIGRYLNHSCTPNVFVQNVFVDTHDPRFPWVAFFALSQIRAGTELTWNYNYDVGSVPGKVLYCYCNAHNCRGRLL